MIKINWDTRTLILLEETRGESSSIERLPQSKEEMLFFHSPDEQQLKTILKLLQDNPSKFDTICLTSPDLEDLKASFFKEFKILEAAGGLVFNEKKEILLIHRLGKWDLPKGKMEAGETREESAVREVQEETGLQRLTLGEPIFLQETKQDCTLHIYQTRKGKWILKPTYWFVMTASENEPLLPQTEESITEVRWQKTDDLQEILANTYPNIEAILRSSLPIPLYKKVS